MKKLLLLALVFLAGVFVLSNLSDLSQKEAESLVSKKPILQSRTSLLRVALVADSHNENDLLEKALRQASGKGINFVIGLGDYTNLGTVEELNAARAKFDESKLEYFLTAGDRDGWESRNRGGDNFAEVFGKASRVFQRNGVQIVILDNSDIYSGISQEDWEILKSITSGQGTTSTTGSSTEKARDTRDTLDSRGTLTFVFAHKTPFHPQSKHIMGEDSEEVSRQARKLIELMEEEKVDGFFSGDIHFFARYQSPANIVKITTIGAVASERNFQGPRFAILTVFSDYSWEVEDVEIR